MVSANIMSLPLNKAKKLAMLPPPEAVLLINNVVVAANGLPTPPPAIKLIVPGSLPSLISL